MSDQTQPCRTCGVAFMMPELKVTRRRGRGESYQCRPCFRSERRKVPTRSAQGRMAERRRREERSGVALARALAAEVRALHRMASWRPLRPRAPLTEAGRAEYQRLRRLTEKGIARRLVQRAVARGDMPKPSYCEACHQPCDARTLHGHHEDYSRPLDVQWLCPRCHVRAHGGRWGAAAPPGIGSCQSAPCGYGGPLSGPVCDLSKRDL